MQVLEIEKNKVLNIIKEVCEVKDSTTFSRSEHYISLNTKVVSEKLGLPKKEIRIRNGSTVLDNNIVYIRTFSENGFTEQEYNEAGGYTPKNTDCGIIDVDQDGFVKFFEANFGNVSLSMGASTYRKEGEKVKSAWKAAYRIKIV